MKRFTFLFFLFINSIYAKSYTLIEAITTALTNNQRHTISIQDIQIAKAKYKQALSANYPTLDISFMMNRRDEAFVDEVKTDFSLPPILGGSTLPINYTHIVTGRDTAKATIQTQYILYSGGKISALQTQAKEAIFYEEEHSKLTDEEIVLDIKKYYAMLFLSQNLEKIMQQTVNELKTIVELTEAFYNNASLKVKKTDYLRAKMTLLNMQSILLSMKNTTKIARSALAFEMGLKNSQNLEIIPTDINIIQLPQSLEECYTQLYLHNHQLKQLKIALHVNDAKEDEIKSEYLPNIGLYANAQKLYSNIDGGIINEQNKRSWNIGIALKYNLFNGGATTAHLEKTKAEKLKLKAQEAYLSSGLSLKAKDAYLKTKTALKQLKIMKEAVQTAEENSELNLKAYMAEMVSTKDVLEAQFLRSLTKAAYFKTLYQAHINKAELDYIIGSSLQ